MNNGSFGSIFAVVAILFALLIIWSKGWTNNLEENNNTEMRERVRRSATLGALWIYMTVVIAFISLALFLTKEYWEGGIKYAETVGFGFFITAFLMASASVCEATFTLFKRVWRGGTLYDVPRGMANTLYGKSSVRRLIAIVLGSLLFSTLGVVFTHWWLLGLILAWGYGIWTYIRFTRD